MSRRKIGLVLTVMAVLLPISMVYAAAPDLSKVKRFEIVRGMSDKSKACIECHKECSPGVFGDWAKSMHARANITCLDCHQAEKGDKDIATGHSAVYNRTDLPYGERKYFTDISAVVTPKDCSRCHPDEAEEYSRSKHANTMEIMWKVDPWLNDGMINSMEQETGCYTCHGTVLEMKDGKLTSECWPNVGVGRVNLDGSLGSCTSCHTRHRFSIAEARKPEACGQCHLGPDHPQIEIYTESKHGAIYNAEGDEWNFDAAPGTWTAGSDYRAPTCATCHMSGVGKVHTSHDVTERLSWELQAKTSVRPQDFKPFPSKSDWKVERNKMKTVCLECHANSWVDNHYERLDRAVNQYNDVYWAPVKGKMAELYKKKLLDKTKYFDEPLEVESYEMWHHEGRRARMGTAMMAPDYAWWHGFYECKKRYADFFREAKELEESGHPSYKQEPWPNGNGDRTNPLTGKIKQK